ncbi:hypothetical protein FQR65_LT15008 [Abscondita terminalis]|nr:hypothetical protein FQR65_LT15008 [Abscondita terminalis]
MVENDYQMALLLQKEFDHEQQVENPNQNLVYGKKNVNRNNTKSLVDPSWEVIDPTPNIHVLFMAFNEKYFWNKLLAVCVSWSKRMTSCAGICSYQGRAGLCHITLSEPLLKLRPRKDLVETLLHEMIHAFLFVTHNNKDRDGHGPEFHKHMYRINAEAGTNITVYHSFHDEVRLYQQHWWRCDGPCQQRKPYFGMVRRATNRAPGPYDRWWIDHQQNCGGTFIKVKEPEKTTKKSQKENRLGDSKNDIRKFYPVVPVNKVQTGTGTKMNSSSTVVITKKSGNVHEVEPKSHMINKPNLLAVFTGIGRTLTTKSNGNELDGYANVRNHWVNKYPQKDVSKRSCSDLDTSSQKRIKTDTVECPACHVELSMHDVNEHLDLCLSNDSVTSSVKEIIQETVVCLVCGKNVIKNNLNEHLDECVNDSVFNNSDVIEIPDDVDFNSSDGDKDKQYNCPVCLSQCKLVDMSVHLDACLMKNNFSGIFFDEEF